MQLRRTPRSRSLPELTPLVDVVFQLLVFFLLTSTLAQRGIAIELPEASTAGPTAREAHVVALDGAGRLYLDGREIEEVRLKERFGTWTRELPVVLSADAEVPYRRVLGLIDALRESGIGDVVLAGRPPQRGGP